MFSPGQTTLSYYKLAVGFDDIGALIGVKIIFGFMF